MFKLYPVTIHCIISTAQPALRYIFSQKPTFSEIIQEQRYLEIVFTCVAKVELELIGERTYQRTVIPDKTSSVFSRKIIVVRNDQCDSKI